MTVFLKIILDIFLRYETKVVLVTNIVTGYSVNVVIAGSIAFAQRSMLMIDKIDRKIDG